MTRCPCGSRKEEGSCCASIIGGERAALTAEELMRSRFTAFARGRADYLADSWAPETRPRSVDVGVDRTWCELEIIATEGGTALAQEGVVEFIARYVDPSGSGVLHERSRFRRHDGRWVYVDGTQTR